MKSSFVFLMLLVDLLVSVLVWASSFDLGPAGLFFVTLHLVGSVLAVAWYRRP